MVVQFIEVAVSALMLLVGWQEEHLTCKKWVRRCWCGYLSGEMQMTCIWSRWCHCHPIISASVKCRTVCPSDTSLPRRLSWKKAIKRVLYFFKLFGCDISQVFAMCEGKSNRNAGDTCSVAGNSEQSWCGKQFCIGTSNRIYRSLHFLFAV